ENLRILSTSGEPVFDGHGGFSGYRGTSQDITDARAAEESSRRDAVLRSFATRLGRMAAWALDVDDMTLCWSSEALDLFGWAADTPMPLSAVPRIMHADYRSAVLAAVTSCIRNGTPFDVEVRASRSGNHSLWIRLIAEAERDSTGRVRHLRGAVQDISERKA